MEVNSRGASAPDLKSVIVVLIRRVIIFTKSDSRTQRIHPPQREPSPLLQIRANFGFGPFFLRGKHPAGQPSHGP